MANLTIPEYIGNVLYEIGGIKGAWLHGLVEAAIQRDGKVPSEEEWTNMVDACSDEVTDLEAGAIYPAVTEVLMNFFIP